MRLRFAPEYQAILASLLEQLGVLVSGSGRTETATPDDPFLAWSNELAGLEPMDRSDPAIERLFPAAYREDWQAQAEFSRLTETDQRLQIVRNVQQVLDDLGAAKGDQVDVSELEPWIKAVNMLRLTLAVRLNVQTADDLDALDLIEEPSPMAYLVRVMHWLGMLLETLVTKA
ncbi:MAG: DUF2017 domain-containing protein [Propionibacteriaceae bacterium]|jgi:hypothetical protein|nr:DUF2017 domain-containing protein [Propionibacteriaceae bacterium]